MHRQPLTLPLLLLLLLVGDVWVEGCNARMAVLASVMIVHFRLVVPDVIGAWPEDEDAEAE